MELNDLTGLRGAVHTEHTHTHSEHTHTHTEHTHTHRHRHRHICTPPYLLEYCTPTRDKNCVPAVAVDSAGWLAVSPPRACYVHTYIYIYVCVCVYTHRYSIIRHFCLCVSPFLWAARILCASERALSVYKSWGGGCHFYPFSFQID